MNYSMLFCPSKEKKVQKKPRKWLSLVTTQTAPVPYQTVPYCAVICFFSNNKKKKHKQKHTHGKLSFEWSLNCPTIHVFKSSSFGQMRMVPKCLLLSKRWGEVYCFLILFYKDLSFNSPNMSERKCLHCVGRTDSLIFWQDDRQRTTNVHQRLERHWLGMIEIPFSTIYLNNKVRKSDIAAPYGGLTLVLSRTSLCILICELFFGSVDNCDILEVLVLLWCLWEDFPAAI